MNAAPVLAVEDLRVHFPTDAGPLRAVDGATWSVRPGETLGIVGESGSGKSLSALAVMGLVPAPGRVEGHIRLEGRDLLQLGERALRRVRGKEIAMVFQDPLTSLNPMFTVGAQIAEAVRAHEPVGRLAARARAVALLSEVGIPNPRRRAGEYPHQFSGGMRQRAMIAMALAADPKVLLADEPTTALDVTVQAQILELLSTLQAERGMAVVLITHDLAVVSRHADRVLVMYAGRLAELADADELFSGPRHAYTLGLLESAVRLDRAANRRLASIPGQPPSLLALPDGCAFHPRCRFATPTCRSRVPPASPNGSVRHVAACFQAQDVRRAHLARAAPADALRPPLTVDVALLDVDGLTKRFPASRGSFAMGRRGAVHAVDGVSLRVFAGRTLALVGESGCGKSTTARAILRLLEPTSGSVRFAGEEITTASAARMRELRREMQLVFQDPYASLNPRMNVGKILREPFAIHGQDTGPDDVRALLDEVGLPPDHASRFPHELSGGERQRVGIARAVALRPRFVVCDEPVSSLDASIQAQVLNLLQDLQRDRGLAYLFIAHDLRVVRHVATRVAVMYFGRIVETAAVDDLFDRPAHPYTQALISAVPLPDPRAERTRRCVLAEGELPDPIRPPSGCPFRTRCPTFLRELDDSERQRCSHDVPELREVARDHPVACHYPGVASAG